MTFSESFRALLGNEGGYVNDPSDAGGETNWGITIAVARSFGYKGSMRDLPVETAMVIYKKLFWDKMSLDDIAMIDYGLAHELFDTGVNVGPARAVKWLQRSLNVMNRQERLYPDVGADGIVGIKTLAALRAYQRSGRDMRALSACVNCLQGCHYISLAERRKSQERFLYGWIKRRVLDA